MGELMKSILRIAAVGLFFGMLLPVGIKGTDVDLHPGSIDNALSGSGPYIYGQAYNYDTSSPVVGLNIEMKDMMNSNSITVTTGQNGNYIGYLNNINGFQLGDQIWVHPILMGSPFYGCNPVIPTIVGQISYYFLIQCYNADPTFDLWDIGAQTLQCHASVFFIWDQYPPNDQINIAAGENAELLAHNCYWDHNSDHQGQTVSYTFYLEKKVGNNYVPISQQSGQYTIYGDGNPWPCKCNILRAGGDQTITFRMETSWINSWDQNHVHLSTSADQTFTIHFT